MPGGWLRRHARGGAARHSMANLVGLVQDHPRATSGALVLLGVVHAVLSSYFQWLNPYKSLTNSANAGTAVTMYLGTAAAAAIVAGFAGVILVFTIGAQTSRIRLFRDQAGKSLRNAWVVVVAEPFAATLLGIVASITEMTSGVRAAPWLFEIGVILLVHGSLRLLWLLRTLIEIVGAEDLIARRDASSVSASELFPPRA